MTQPTFDLDRYKALLAAGLTSGMGTTERACIMACLNLACGGTLTDAAESPCVLPAAASFAIRLNDAKWSSEKARADGLHDLGLSLIGTDGLDWKVFVSRLAGQTIRQVVPVFQRRAKLVDAAKRCEEAGTEDAARAARKDAAYAADAAAYAADAANAADAAYDAAYAADAANAAYAAAYAAYAANAAYAAAYAAYAANAAYAAYRAKHGDETLILSARIATNILNDMKAGR